MNESAWRAGWYQLGAVAENGRGGSLTARGLVTSIPDVARICDLMLGREGPPPTARVMEEMPRGALSGSGGRRRKRSAGEHGAASSARS